LENIEVARVKLIRLINIVMLRLLC